MKIHPNFVLREILGESMLVPLGEAATRFNGLISLNETGGAIVRYLQQDRTMEELTALITAEYDIDPATAQGDIREYVDQLRQIGALVED
ncbi:MAG: PqqD family protein [Oscillospiraceae bacterium]|nr:PqqD family protein [Oscillospiraceae bacterium]